jgi:hypothetical protein
MLTTLDKYDFGTMIFKRNAGSVALVGALIVYGLQLGDWCEMGGG